MSFERWCAHYGYDPDSEAAAADWRRYLEGLELVESLTFCGARAMGKSMTPEQRERLQRLHQQHRRLVAEHRQLRDGLDDEERDEHQRALCEVKALIARAEAMLVALAGAEAEEVLRRIRGEGEP